VPLKCQRKQNIKHTRTIYPKINKNKIYDLASVEGNFTFFLGNFSQFGEFFSFQK
jgi:hypothetical protein